MILKFNFTTRTARIRTTYLLDYAIVGFCHALLEKVGDFAFLHPQLTVYPAALT